MLFFLNVFLLTRLSFTVPPPLIYDHINFLWRHFFLMPEAVARGELRPLRSAANDMKNLCSTL